MSHQATAPLSTSESQPALVPRLGLTGLVIFGVSYMAPAVVIATFGVIALLSQGAAPLAYAVATAAMVLTALSYGKLAREFPNSGSIYTYARRVIGSRFGFLAGWTILLDYLFLPMVAWLITGLYLSAQFPVLPSWAWGLIVITLTTVVNVIGLKLADRLNRVLLLLVMVAVASVVVLGIAAATGGGAPARSAIWPSDLSISAVVVGAAVAAYSFLGFDAVSTMSEEVKDPSRNVPRGILAVVLVGGIIFVVTSFVMQWVHPGAAFDDPDTGGFEVLLAIGGPGFAGAVNIAMVVGTLASCIAVQASGSRLLYVMGRDGVFPKRFFGALQRRFKTPVLNLLLIAAIGIAGQFLTMGDATSLINFGAFLAFAVANLCVIVLWARRRGAVPGRARVFAWVVVPILGFAVDIFLLLQLSPLALGIGAAWLLVGVVYLAVITKGFRAPAPGLSIDEAVVEESSEK